tara:strand:+ start:5856 stop:6575 length:720 start_codon:yes stop_codon:yes gene_type:complete
MKKKIWYKLIKRYVLYMWKSNSNSMLGKSMKRKRVCDTDSDTEESTCLPQIPMNGLFDAMIPKGTVRVEDNHIYLYNDITQSSMESLVKGIRELNCELGSMALRYNTEPKIYLHINSDGGEVYPALAAVDTIMKSKIPVITIIEGCAASAATMISVAGTERHMSKHSHMLIHEVRSGFWGKMAQIEEEFDNLEKLMAMIVDIYKTNTKMSVKEIHQILKKDEMWDPEKCLKKGLIDKIV